MIKFYSFILVFISFFLIYCSEINYNESAAEVIDYESSMGWLHGSCLAIKNKNISKGSLVTIVQLDEPQNISSATVSNEAKDGEKCFPILGDRRKINIESGYSFYLINSELDINLGIAVIEGVMNIEEYTFDYCTTTEGILYSVKEVNKNNGKNIWSGYYYLDYESEATCDTKSNN